MRFHFVFAMIAFAGQFAAAEERPVRFINEGEVKTLDPHQTSWLVDFRIIEALYEGLLNRDPRTLQPVEGVAQYPPRISADRKTYTFTLRENATWSNGDPVTAHDFEWSWKRVLDPATAAEYAQLLFVVDGAEAYFNTLRADQAADFSSVGVCAIDARTLEVRLRAPTPYFMSLCAFPTLFPVHRATLEKFAEPVPGSKREAVRYRPEWWRPKNLVHNGPLAIESWEERVRMVLKRRPGHWAADRVASDTIVVLPIENVEQAFNVYEQGLADVLCKKPPKRIADELMKLQKAGKRPDVHPVLNFGTYYYLINVNRKPLDDARVRRALSLAIQRDLLAQRVKGHGEQAAEVLVPPNTGDYVSPPGLGFDPARAKQELANAGFPDGKGFPRIRLLFNQDAGHLEVAEVIKALWRRHLNIEIDLEQTERITFSERRKKQDFDIARGGWYGDYFDPMTFLDLWITRGGNNDTGWSNPEFDQLIGQALVEPDEKKRNQQLAEAERLLITENAVVIPLYTYAEFILFDPKKVDGVYPNAMNHVPLHLIRLK